MKLYPIPGGTWEGTEADWKKAMKARGFNPKDFEDTKTREVPVQKKDLLEFLNFYAVDVYRTGTTESKHVDVEALRAQHNPEAPRPVPAAPQPGETEATVQISRMDNPGSNIDGVVEFIANARGHTLKRFASAVALAFGALAGG